MIRKASRKASKRYPARKRVRRAPRRRNTVPEWASCSVAIPAYGQPVSGGYAPNTAYQINQIALEQFARALNVARNYQEFRIKMVECQFRPFYDTFSTALAPGGAGATDGASAPYLHYIVDKRGAVPSNFNLSTLKMMGAKPVRFDEKLITVKFKPGVMSLANETSGAAPTALATGKVMISPWLPVNETPNAPTGTTINTSTTNHAGLSFWIQQDYAGSLIPQGGLYILDLTAHFEFRKPNFGYIAPGEVAPAPAVQLVHKVAELEHSQ